MVKTRYDIAMDLQDDWKELNWKGEPHTEGIYFNQEYGYVIERTICMRIPHNEPVASVFYKPAFTDEQTEEVFCSFPYHDMSTNPHKYEVLFKGRNLKEEQLTSIFEGDQAPSTYLPAEPFIELAKQIPQKRERDRAWIYVDAASEQTKVYLCQKKKNEYTATCQISFENEKNIGKGFQFTVNANSLLFALTSQPLTNYILFSKYHGRIKLTKGDYPNRVDIVLATPKEHIEKEIIKNLR